MKRLFRISIFQIIEWNSASRIWRCYSGPFEYWHMSEEDYQKARSGEVISNKRLKILDRITDSRLMGVADAIAASKTAGYQESIFE